MPFNFGRPKTPPTVTETNAAVDVNCRTAEVVQEMETPLTPNVHIRRLTFSDGSALELDRGDIIILVGPNNAGKSATLRGIQGKLTRADAEHPVVRSVEFVKSGVFKDVATWLNATSNIIDREYEGLQKYKRLNAVISMNDVEKAWAHEHSLLRLTKFFCRMISAEDRLAVVNPPSTIAMTSDAIDHPIQLLFRYEALEQKVSRAFRNVFGLELIVHRSAGKTLPLYTGDRSHFGGTHDWASLEYVQYIEANIPLARQGDGMKSFAGLLMETLLGWESVLLVDEPESFLHPPKARQVGRLLAGETHSGKQIIVATHSGDVLRGVLDVNNPKVRVVRIERRGEINRVYELSSARIAELWSDPLLRYSNILDGVFHDQVVVTEGDGDCRYYAAVAEALFNTGKIPEPMPDVMYTHPSGNARLPMVIRSLKQLGVLVKCVADIDLLNNPDRFRLIIEASGGEWSDYEKDWRIIETHVNQSKPQLSTEEVRGEILAILADRRAQFILPDTRRRVEQVLKRWSPWSAVKSNGIDGLPDAESIQAGLRLLKNLKSINIFLVPVGELECFDKRVGDHGPAWVAEAIRAELATDTYLEPVRQFVHEIITHIPNTQ